MHVCMYCVVYEHAEGPPTWPCKADQPSFSVGDINGLSWEHALNSEKFII